jgi:regulator of protease activity HflC (stomatin/prohibitin superfamily)
VESALAWIGQIAAWIGHWVPRWIVVVPTHACVKYEGFFLPRRLRVRHGGFDGEMRITAKGPGLFWYWPATTRVDDYPTAYQSDDLKSQSFETSDDHSISVGGCVSYVVIDIVTLLSGNQSPMKTITVHTMSAIHKVCCGMTLAELKEEQRRGTLGTKLKNAAQRDLAEWGVVVRDCRLTDLTRSRTLRVIQSTQADAA